MNQVLAPNRLARRRTRGLAWAGLAGVLYALCGCSNTPASLGSLAKGAMAKLVVTERPEPAPDTVFRDAIGKPHTLAEFKGQVLIVNVWANWCAPCKEEIPSLARLQADYAGKGVAIVPVSVGKGEDETAGHAFIDRNPPLTFYTEPTYALTFAFKPPVDGMPTTILYDRKGVERARLTGGADWSGGEAHAVVDSLLAEPSGSRPSPPGPGRPSGSDGSGAGVSMRPPAFPAGSTPAGRWRTRACRLPRR
jgi:thiol-disulfide isomerase/thioredoxin